MQLKSKLILSISHLIFLSKEQRYNLHKNHKIRVTGVSLPVWFYKGKTTEPAEEVFCKYWLTNNKEYPKSIKLLKYGYRINLPQIPPNYVQENLSDTIWRIMTEHQRSDWYKEHEYPLSSKKLLDLVDGGSQQLFFEIKEVKSKNDNKLNIFHSICIKDTQLLD